MEKINYLDQYGRNNLTEKPLEYYLEAFEKTDPYKISRRLGIPYDPLRKEFTFYFLGQTYIARCSDFQINPVDSEDNLFGRNPKARILLLRYLLYSTVYFPDGEFKSYREFPSGELYYDVFRGRCINQKISFLILSKEIMINLERASTLKLPFAAMEDRIVRIQAEAISDIE